ncbi:segregation/condensation protein A [Candidatus Kaiserbacteria bacterium]|nr:segregation/condensation protein A [Candidatus Kaiserbacteria bacterium]
MTAFSLETSGYTGPLDALLTLIEDRKLSISEVSLAEVTDAYLSYVESLPQLPLGETAQFILIASTLLLIKSRTLLPSVDLTEEETQSIEELERRLARYALIRKCAKVLRNKWGSAPLRFPKRQPSPEYAAGREASFNPGETTLALLLRAAQSLLSTLPKPEKLAEATVAPVLKLEEVISNLRTRLASSIRTKWSELTNTSGKYEMIVHFLAILELVRSGSVSATQEKLFSDILLETEALGAPRY